MIIGKTITIELEENEIKALRTLKDAYTQCEVEECYECGKCPLIDKEICIGKIAENLLLKTGVKL